MYIKAFILSLLFLTDFVFRGMLKFLEMVLIIFKMFVKYLSFCLVKAQFLGFGANIILCWRCEESECNRYFDFTQHTAEQCDGKCWKSYDIIEAKTKEEREQATG